ncbi:hypothetical protein PCANB_002641 [Pneumocystis canis]|nr:hypothetical protein PCK1_002675 [Pneumocystis canis]KAG5438537.1 hypothetical protein PCANB_002641 [Pneumocystis canis]
MLNLEETIYHVVPTLERPYPNILLETADRLIQWSYQKEMMLKPKEEVARIRLCIHIACERLSKQLSLPTLSIEKLPLPIKRYQVLLERFRHELTPQLDRNAMKDIRKDDKELSLCLEMIHDLCDKMNLKLYTKYFIKTLNVCYNRYPEIHYMKGLVAIVFILVLSRLTNEHMVNRVEKKQILSILNICDMKQTEWKQWDDLIKKDNAKCGWLDAIFEKIHSDKSIEIDPIIEAEPPPQAISGIGMMIHPQVDFYGHKHYLKYLKWKKDILKKISSIKKSKDQLDL